MEANTTQATDQIIEVAIKNWTLNLSAPEKLKDYLNQGNCFSITREEYNIWKENSPTFVHAYPAVFNDPATGEDVLKFVVTDNVTDANLVIDYSMVFTKNYTHGAKMTSNVDLDTDSNITIQEALERMFRWSMTMETWVDKQARQVGGIFQAFNLPFSDFDTLFGIDSVTKVTCILALRADNVADMIVWDNDLTFAQGSMEDTVLPVPPFSLAPISSYQLLVQSMNAN